jgi:hypothetical protein
VPSFTVLALAYSRILVAFFLAAAFAAWLALRTAVPGRTVSAAHLVLLAILILASFLIEGRPYFSDFLGPFSMQGAGTASVRIIVIAGLPWIALYWGARRAVPLNPKKTGALIGAAAGCYAIGFDRLQSLSGGASAPLVSQALALGFGMVASAIIGARWLNARGLWNQPAAPCDEAMVGFEGLRRMTLPSAVVAAGLFAIVAVRLDRIWGAIPDFDLAISQYERSMRGFEPNVPSQSIDTVLTAYVEDGMPSYMWDFGPHGFKLVGGRFEHLADGTPATFTWFRGSSAGMMCIFRKIAAFTPPALPHLEHRGLLFYRYRGFSICLINVGNYGNFVSVIASPMPMRQFEPIVSASAG